MTADVEPLEPRRQRRDLITDLERLWRHDPELRFGQLVMQALTVAHDLSADDLTALIDDDHVRVALHERWAWESKRKVSVAPPPYWDAETHTGRTFLNGLPRDPARIGPFLDALREAWDRRSNLNLCALIAPIAGSLGSLGGIEDGRLRQGLAALGAAQP